MKRILRAFLSVVTCGLMAAVLSSCETESAATKVRINPSSVTIRKGEAVTFTASGGTDYTWSLGTTPRGTLSSRYGASVTYTSQYNPGADVMEVETITVSSEPPEGTASGEAPEQWTAEAYITHMGMAVETGKVAIVEAEMPADPDPL